MLYEEGEQMRILKKYDSGCSKDKDNHIGKIGVISFITSGGDYRYRLLVDGIDLPYFWRDEEIELVNKSITTNNMSLMQTLQLVLKKEPEKTFIQTGVMNDKEELTPDGTALFLGWLLAQNKDAFNKDVVAVIKKEQDKAKDK